MNKTLLVFPFKGSLFTYLQLFKKNTMNETLKNLTQSGKGHQCLKIFKGQYDVMKTENNRQNSFDDKTFILRRN